MDILTAKIGANMAKSELAEGGQIGYSEMTETVIVPEMTVTEGGYHALDEGVIAVGETYIVIYDGVEYECEAHMDEPGFGFIVIGNGWFFNDDVTDGLPFCIADSGNIIVRKDGKAHTISCVQRTETVHTIDPKYLPGAVLPVVTLTTLVPSEDGAAELSAEESAQMDAATQDGMPVYISVGISLEGVEIARVGAVCVLLMTSEKTTAAVPAAGMQISVTKSSGETLWTVQLE